jgi:hypothetical protein
MGLDEQLARLNAHRDAASSERASVFSALKSADPAQAAFLQAIAAEFGKPAAIEIRQGGKTYRQGTFTPAHDFPDFTHRLVTKHG